MVEDVSLSAASPVALPSAARAAGARAAASIALAFSATTSALSSAVWPSLTSDAKLSWAAITSPMAKMRPPPPTQRRLGSTSMRPCASFIAPSSVAKATSFVVGVPLPRQS